MANIEFKLGVFESEFGGVSIAIITTDSGCRRILFAKELETEESPNYGYDSFQGRLGECVGLTWDEFNDWRRAFFNGQDWGYRTPYLFVGTI